MQTVRVGADLISLRRMRRILDGPSGKAFVGKTFTQREIETAGMRGDATTYYATRFAGKEAVFKSLDIAWAETDNLRDIEIGSNPDGVPTVTLAGRFRQLADERSIGEPTLSLSYDDEYAFAVAISVAELMAGPDPTQSHST